MKAKTMKNNSEIYIYIYIYMVVNAKTMALNA